VSVKLNQLDRSLRYTEIFVCAQRAKQFKAADCDALKNFFTHRVVQLLKNSLPGKVVIHELWALFNEDDRRESSFFSKRDESTEKYRVSKLFQKQLQNSPYGEVQPCGNMAVHISSSSGSAPKNIQIVVSK